MSTVIPGNIGDTVTFNINCVGDTFQSLETPTILFESGHFKEDYQENFKKICLFLLIYAVKAILNTNIDYKTYYQIPENKNNYVTLK